MALLLRELGSVLRTLVDKRILSFQIRLKDGLGDCVRLLSVDGDDLFFYDCLTTIAAQPAPAPAPQTA